MKMMGSGFTAVELMVVIAVFSVLVAVSLPLILSSLPKYRQRAAARELVIDFKRAKAEAAKRNRHVLIQFTAAGGAGAGGGYVLCVDHNANHTCDPDEEFARVAMPRGIRLTGATFSNSNTCGYDPRGMPWRNRWGRVDVVIPGESKFYRINLSRNGAVRMATMAL